MEAAPWDVGDLTVNYVLNVQLRGGGQVVVHQPMPDDEGGIFGVERLVWRAGAKRDQVAGVDYCPICSRRLSDGSCHGHAPEPDLRWLDGWGYTDAEFYLHRNV